MFKAIHKEDPSRKHCTNAQKLINLAMNHWRKSLKMSIIMPKSYGMEARVMMQMLDIKGGISRLIEHWVKQYHQVGHRYDLSCTAD